MKHKAYVCDDAPEIAETPEVALAISKAMLESLKKRNFLTQAQVDQCVEQLEKTYKNV
ncbi:MAG: hypothetical protein J1E00_02435 [Oscillospiraceae bacterium]|nr:hypothetical protein [Oscillospiraceae bacterium]